MQLMHLYEKLPICIQNIAVSIYGFLREKKRYGGDFPRKLEILKKQEFASEEFIDSYQKSELRQLLSCANKSVHYHSVFEERGIHITAEDPIEALKRMPILSKQELRGKEQAFQTAISQGDQIFHTSGSTGTPLTVRMNIDDFRQRMAILERMKLRFGVDHTTRHISFVGKKITSRDSGIFWRINRPGHQMVMSVYNLRDDNSNAYINAIRSFKPEMMEGYPSALAIVARWFLEKKELFKLKCVLVTAETLFDDQRSMIEKAFGCPVINYYGSTEGATMITPCECGNLHIEFESGIVEFLDDRGHQALEGTEARMVITSFLTKSTPLIRYDIGDMAVVGGNKCKCGRCTQTVQSIVGRCDDVFRTTDKGYVGRLSTTLKLLPSFVRRAQIQQIDTDSFILLLESEENLSKEQEELVVEDLCDKLGKVEIRIDYTSRIPVGPNGKFRSQISLIG